MPSAGAFVLDGAEGRHAATVRRMRVGEILILTDGAGSWCSATVFAVGKAELSLLCQEAIVEPEATPRVTIVQALPKGERSDLAVDLATEAGVDVIVPWSASRCVARWSPEKAAKGVHKWQAVAREAGKQSRRVWFPLIGDLASSRQVAILIASTIAGGGTALLLHEAQSQSITEIEFPVTDVVLVIGPEGGISPDEVAEFTEAGAVPVRLGHEVLRTSTAGAVALGALGALTPRWR
ncbi:16S rRNA (uracil(1498)-N(3))-methyltransferase [Nakamurella antarctica]|uniref:Ribosomal RNA small subunit methyltransferase E n=2 Tax=Nakamurella antarctica TaxID=1902245 RepID=A0A3G8ZQW5_9ACTN|nr:16S rRNA (uracil(1498)-N(3))-methyltransferase [Nakamurella antarctica]